MANVRSVRDCILLTSFAVLGGGLAVALADTGELEETVGRPRIVADVLVRGDELLGEAIGIWGFLGVGTDWVGHSSYYLTPYQEFGNGSMRDALDYVAVRLEFAAELGDPELLPGCVGGLVVAYGTLVGSGGKYVLELEADFHTVVSHAQEKTRQC